MSSNEVSRDSLDTRQAACTWLVLIAEECEPPRPGIVAWLENHGQRCYLETKAQQEAFND